MISKRSHSSQDHYPGTKIPSPSKLQSPEKSGRLTRTDILKSSNHFSMSSQNLGGRQLMHQLVESHKKNLNKSKTMIDNSLPWSHREEHFCRYHRNHPRARKASPTKERRASPVRAHGTKRQTSMTQINKNQGYDIFLGLLNTETSIMTDKDSSFDEESQLLQEYSGYDAEAFTPRNGQENSTSRSLQQNTDVGEFTLFQRDVALETYDERRRLHESSAAITELMFIEE